MMHEFQLVLFPSTIKGSDWCSWSDQMSVTSEDRQSTHHSAFDKPDRWTALGEHVKIKQSGTTGTQPRILWSWAKRPNISNHSTTGSPVIGLIVPRITLLAGLVAWFITGTSWVRFDKATTLSGGLWARHSTILSSSIFPQPRNIELCWLESSKTNDRF
jgi:hypothetical protein